MQRSHTRLFLVLRVVLCLLPSAVSAQVTADPNDPLYTSLTVWQVKGYIRQLPVIRPYPLQTIKKLLREAIDHAEGTDLALARSYWDGLKLDAREDSLSLGYLMSTSHAGLEVETVTDGTSYFLNGIPGINTTGFLNHDTSYSGRFAFEVTDSPGDSFFPEYASILDDSLTGNAVFTLGGKKYTVGQLSQFGLAVGDPGLYFQAGLMRTAFGPSFDNSVVIGPQAPAAGHVSFTYQNDWFSFSTLFLDLVAQEYYDIDNGYALTYLTNTDLPLAKYLVIQTMSFHPLDWLEFGFIQTVVTGELLHLYYILPFPLQDLFYSAQLSGDYDTSFIGLYGSLRLPFGLVLDGTFYVDDWDSFSALAASQGMLINFNSAQDKFALDAVLSYCPPIEILERISLEYQMVTPYTYTHSRYYAVNWIMYTNAGEKLGSILEPNSDMLSLKVNLQPASWLDSNIFGRMIRHGNASEGITAGDGTIYDDGFDNAGNVTFVGVPSRFLTQSVIETTFQAGADVGCRFHFGRAELTGRLGYTFQYVWNKDLIAGYEALTHFVSVSIGFRY
jgi:hypothetical protein